MRLSIFSAAASTRPRLGVRQRPVGRVREVLLLDRRADALREAGEAGVLRADVALEVRELAHELRGLVGLRQARGLARGLAAAQHVDELLEPRRPCRPSCPAPATNVIEPS